MPADALPNVKIELCTAAFVAPTTASSASASSSSASSGPVPTMSYTLTSTTSITPSSSSSAAHVDAAPPDGSVSPVSATPPDDEWEYDDETLRQALRDHPEVKVLLEMQKDI